MEELERHGKLGLAALRAGLHRNTARRYRDLGRVPSELNAPRAWRTREDPFVEEDWLAQQLAEAPRPQPAQPRRRRMAVSPAVGAGSPAGAAGAGAASGKDAVLRRDSLQPR
jgi:hypothetical protein